MIITIYNANPPEGVTDYELLQIYNGLDTQATWEIAQALRPQLDENARAIYCFERAQLAPAMDMMLRGLLVDPENRFKAARLAAAKMKKAEEVFTKICQGVFDKIFSIGSPAQLSKLFYDELGLPVQRHKKTGNPTTDVSALEILATYAPATYLVKCIQVYRDNKKLREVLTVGIDPDGRMRTSYNVGATETGRWSSSKSAFTTGTNLQNQTPEVRHIYVADTGYKMGNVDLRQAESRGIGYLAGDTAYIKACEGGDLHTAVAMLVYQDIEWPNSSNSQKRMAEEKFYRHFSRRDLAKRGGHLTNYYGKQQGVADAMQVSLSVGAEFQRGYKKAFPGIPAYHHWVQQQLGRHGQLTTPLGRTRTFLGRSSSEETLREAIAYGPQSLIVDIVDIALLKVFMTCYPMIQLQTQTHDSISFQFLEADEAEAIVAVEKCFEIDIDITGIDKIKRTMHIPTESKTGWNLGKYSTENPDGLKDYHGRDERRRQRPAQIPVLDWRFLKSDYLPSLSTSL